MLPLLDERLRTPDSGQGIRSRRGTISDFGLRTSDLEGLELLIQPVPDFGLRTSDLGAQTRLGRSDLGLRDLDSG